MCVRMSARQCVCASVRQVHEHTHGFGTKSTWHLELRVVRAPNQCSVVLLFNIVQVNQGPGGGVAWFLLARDAFLPLAQEVVRAQRLDRNARFVFEVKQLELALRLLFQPMLKSHLCVCVRARACS